MAIEVPDYLIPELREILARHLCEQIQQYRGLGHDHPQGARARLHLARARALAELVGESMERAA